MKKILILAYDFPPYVSVAGLRPFSWYKYLNLFDIYPIVVTRQWKNRFGNSLDYVSPGYSNVVEKKKSATGILIETPYKSSLADRMFLRFGKEKFRTLRRLITSYYEFLQFVLPIGNKKNLYFAADEYLKNNKVDCIIATGDPFVLFKYASELGEKYSIPWIADYRDSWVQDKSMSSRLYKIWSALFEKRFLKNVAKITTVSTFFQKQIETNIRGKSFAIVYNGYDPDILEITKNIQQSNSPLSVAFAGTIYNWHPIESFLRVCAEMIADNNDFKLRLNFYGINKEEEIKELLRENYKSLERFVSFYPRTENLALAKEFAKHNAYLLFNDYSILGTKIFDYLAMKRKIILCYEDDLEASELKGRYYCIDEITSESPTLQADMIKATNSGIVVKDAEHLRSVLRDLIAELKEKGFVECESFGIEAYSRIKQVEKLAEVIKEVTI